MDIKTTREALQCGKIIASSDRMLEIMRDHATAVRDKDRAGEWSQITDQEHARYWMCSVAEWHRYFKWYLSRRDLAKAWQVATYRYNAARRAAWYCKPVSSRGKYPIG